MEKVNTKREILKASLDLFSTQGYESTSVAQIADAVGIKKATVYSHFSSKQQILDDIIEIVSREYSKRSFFADDNQRNESYEKTFENFADDEILSMILSHVNFIVKNQQVSKVRKMLTIEQFQNVKLKEMQTKRNYDDVMNYFVGLVKCLIEQNKLQNNDPEVMAAQLCLPISVWINLCDREPERIDETMNLVEKHIKLFFKTYGTI